MQKDTPWLEKKNWAANKIHSNSKSGMYGLIGFSVILWGLIAFLYSIKADLLEKFEQEPLVALILILPIAGLSLLFATYKSISHWRDIGPTPLVLDPFPGSIGGQTGGFIETNIPYDSNLKMKVELQCVHTYMSGSGKSRSRKHRVKWQQDGICHTDISAKGSRFQFRFDVPQNLPEADISRGSQYNYWRLQIASSDKAVKLDRQFDIPVFPTEKQSISINAGTEDYQETINSANQSVESIANIKESSGQVELYFPGFQRPFGAVIMILVGVIFASAGIAVGIYGDAPIIFPIVFPLVGSLILLGGLYSLGKALFVKINKEGITTRRFLFGLPITTKQLSLNDFIGFKEKNTGSTQSGNKSTVTYQVIAENSSGKGLIVAERLNSQSELNSIKTLLERYI